MFAMLISWYRSKHGGIYCTVDINSYGNNHNNVAIWNNDIDNNDNNNRDHDIDNELFCEWQIIFQSPQETFREFLQKRIFREPRARTTKKTRPISI